MVFFSKNLQNFIYCSKIKYVITFQLYIVQEKKLKKLIFISVLLILALSLFAAQEENKEKLQFWGNVSIQGFAGDKEHVEFDDRFSSKFKFLSELELNGKYQASDNIEFNATGVVGNYMNILESDPYDKKNTVSARLYYLNGKYTNKNFGTLTVGEFGQTIHPYVFKRSVNEWYFDNPRMADYQMIGADYRNALGSLDYDLWYGRLGKNGFDDWDRYIWNYGLGSVDGYDHGHVTDFSGGTVKNYWGAKVGYDFKPVKVTGIYSQADNTENSNKAKIYGGSVNAPLSFVNFDGNYFEQKTDNMEKARMWDLKLSRSYGRLNAGISYIYIGKGYNAMGDWVFVNGNRQSAKGYEFDLGYKFSDEFSIDGYVQTGESFAANSADIMRAQWNFRYTIDDANSLCFTWRNRAIKYDDAAHSFENWFVLKYSHKFADNINWLLGYENYHQKNGPWWDKDTSGTVFSQLKYNF